VKDPEIPSAHSEYTVPLSEWELVVHVPESVAIEAVNDPAQHSAALIVPYNYIHEDVSNIIRKNDRLRSARFTGIIEKGGETCCTSLYVILPGFIMRALARTRGTEAQATVYIENYDLTSNEKLI
jgi:hypothetical protein